MSYVTDTDDWGGVRVLLIGIAVEAALLGFAALFALVHKPIFTSYAVMSLILAFVLAFYVSVENDDQGSWIIFFVNPAVLFAGIYAVWFAAQVAA